jgi:putative membrane protein
VSQEWEFMPWYGMIFGPLMMIIVFAAIIAVAVLLVRWLGGGSHGVSQHDYSKSSETALDILKERFARGQIEKDEFEEKKRLLSD